jgi:hypothetical protein
MKNINKKNIRKIISSWVVLCLIFTGIVITSAPSSVVADCNTCTDTPTVRIYGEEAAVYPTHSFTDGTTFAQDFIYLDETQPFDPGMIQKDSITFNAAFLDHEHGVNAQGNAAEKVFLRAFYEPYYWHKEDAIMSSYGSYNLRPILYYEEGDFNAIVTETTYFLTTLEREPVVGYAGNTKMVLPYASGSSIQPGMDVHGLVDVVSVHNGQTPAMLTDGCIAVEKEFYVQNYDLSDPNYLPTMEFMDHKITIMDFEDNIYNPSGTEDDKLTFKIQYTGNPDGLEENFGKDEIYEFWEDDYWYGTPTQIHFNRDNQYMIFPPDVSDPAHRWYLRIESASPTFIRITLGRYLAAGETFYVDGVRYDMPAIYVDEMCGFKYITLQTPIPKAESPQTTITYVDDFTHVTSQYLYRLERLDPVWMLYPFNWDHVMVDDIGIDKFLWEEGCYEIPTKGILLEEMVGPLDFWWVSEEIEERFNSSLTERLRTDWFIPGRATDIPPEIPEENWYWWNVYTMPNAYTEFYLPDQEMVGDNYNLNDIPLWYEDMFNYDVVDGNEYLITESYIAPNCEADMCRDDLCKTEYEHEILDRCWELITEYKQYDSSYDKFGQYYKWPRMIYEHDAVDGSDLYINEYECQCDESYDATVRIYGEEDYFYPTHSYSGEYDDFYKSETDPFNPGIIAKDSITFNAAWLDHDYGVNAQGNAAEKVFLRAFYEPEYDHPRDLLMDDWSQSNLLPVEEFNAVVTETTYFLTTLDREPVVGYPGETKFVMPYVSNNDLIPGMDTEGLLDVINTVQGSPDYLTDGGIKAEKEFLFLNYDLINPPVMEFMDHKITVLDFEDGQWDSNDKLLIQVEYTGNPEEEGIEDNFGKTEIYELSEDEYFLGPDQTPVERYFTRDNKMKMGALYDETDPANRWYLRIETATSNTIRISLGRWLVAGETFYVDGVRYDIPAVYVDGNCGFKYITLQSPIPKADMPDQDKYTYVEDFSHVTSQYLYRLEKCEPVWVLFPFDQNHRMIDDIGLDKFYQEGGDCYEIPVKGILLANEVGPLKFAWVEETIEERFNTSLTQRLDTSCYMCEDWEWWNVFTKPYKYTEFALIDQEMDGGRTTYDPDEIPGWYEDCEYYNIADGNEYLIATSWIAQNCWDEYPWDLCKPLETHDIVDMYLQYILPGIAEEGFDYAPKMTFEFDAVTGEGLFVNQDCSTPPPLQLSCWINMPSQIDVGTQLTITGMASGGTSPYTFEWIIDGTPVSGQSVITSFSTPGIKQISLTVTDSGSGSYQQVCTDSGQITVTQSGGSGGCCDMTLTVSNLVTCQDPASVTISIPDADDVTIASFRLEWDDTKFTLASVYKNQGSGTGEWDLIQDITGDDFITISAYKYWPGHTGPVDIVTIEFIPVGVPGDSTLLDLSEVQLWTGQYADLSDSVEVIDGMATINCGGSSYPQGDYNLDDVVNQVDVYLLGMAVVEFGANPPTIPPEADVDMNDDGIVNQADVYLLGMQVIQQG